MDITQQGILLLMKSAITGESYTLPQGFDLEQTYAILKKHSVLPLGYVGAAQCGYSRQLPAMQKLFLAYEKSVLFHQKQMCRIQKIYEAFEKNGIDYMPVKGCNMKNRYPAPELRLMGDADILIRMEQYPAIRPIMLELGFEESVESDHELVWLSKGLMVELHKRLIPSYNKDYFQYYGDGWRLAKFHEGHRFYMSPEDELIYLFTHFAKHYRDGGIGLRHVLDLWVFRRLNPKLDMAYIENTLEKMVLNEFFHNIFRLMDAWFCDGEWDEKTEFLTEVIFRSGSWGQADSHRLSALVKENQSGIPFSERLKKKLRLVFPTAQALSGRYPVLQTKPFLLPFYWIRRFFDVLLHKRNNISLLFDPAAAEISHQEQALAYVGLGFHFHE